MAHASESLVNWRPVPGDARSLYVQLEQELRKRIDSGYWRPGDRLPPERVISAQCNVSVNTVRAAFKGLMEKDIVQRRPKLGTFVMWPGALRPATSSLTLGIAIPNLQSVDPFHAPFSYSVFRGAQMAAERSGHALRLLRCQPSDPVTKAVEELSKLDGALWLSTWYTVCRELAGLGDAIPPCVIMGAPLEGGRVVSVGHDDAQAGQTVARHLLDLGHRRIGVLSQPSDSHAAPGNALRQASFADELAKAGIRPHCVLHAQSCGAELLQAYDRAGAQAEAATAWYTPSGGLQAQALLDILRQKGKRVPQDATIVSQGCGLVEGHLNPPVTAYSVPVEELGKQAVNIIAAHAEGGKLASLVIDGRLVVRESSAPPPIL